MIAIMCKCLVCIVFVLVRECQPLKCWSCSSIYDADCDDPFKPDDLDVDTATKYFLYDCEILFQLLPGYSELDQNLTKLLFGPGGKAYCRKTIFKGYGTTVVGRGCSFGDDVSKECRDYHPEVCSNHACYEDGCNRAPSIERVNILSPSVLLILWSVDYLYSDFLWP